MQEEESLGTRLLLPWFLMCIYYTLYTCMYMYITGMLLTSMDLLRFFELNECRVALVVENLDTNDITIHTY